MSEVNKAATEKRSEPTAAIAQSEAYETAHGISDSNPETVPTFGPPKNPDEIGTLGPYRVLKELGRGGMGAVYLGFDERLKRKVALKVMLPKYAAMPSSKSRFLREARAAASITHDHIVTIYEADEHNLTPYMAMQLLQGFPLDVYVKQKGNLELKEILRIGREIALGLEAAHSIGLIHRDIKPANIWLEAPNGRAKILDFGLAKPTDERKIDGELTATGAIMGTPSYMPPEQARGAKGDFRSDLFSLGVVLYRLTTGRLPFTGETMMAVLAAVVADDPKPVREWNPSIPKPLATLIHELMEKKPEQRPQSAAEVAERLHQIQLGAEAAVDLPIQVIPLDALPTATRIPSGTDPFAEIDATEPIDQSYRSDSRSSSRKKTATPKWPLIALGLFIIALFIVIPQIISIMTPKGTLVIESSDPDVEITVKQDGAVIVDRSKGREFRLRVADNYAIELNESDGLKLSTNKFEITRNNKTIVKVRVDRPAVVAKPSREPKPAQARELRRFLGHQGIVTTLAVLNGGNSFISVGGDRKAIVWSTNRTEPLKFLDGGVDVLWSVAVDPQGNWVAAGGQDHTQPVGDFRIRVWDLKTGQLKHYLKGQESTISSLVATEDGKTLISGSWDHTVHVWDAVAGTAAKQPFPKFPAPVTSLALNERNHQLAIGHSDGSLDLGNWRTGQLNRHVQVLEKTINSMDWVSGEIIAVAGMDQTAALVDLTTGQIRKLNCQSERIGISAVPGGEYVVTTGSDEVTRVWSVSTGQEVGHFEPGCGASYIPRVLPDGLNVLLPGSDQTIRLWNLPLPPNSNKPSITFASDLLGYELPVFATHDVPAWRSSGVLASIRGQGTIRFPSRNETTFAIDLDYEIRGGEIALTLGEGKDFLQQLRISHVEGLCMTSLDQVRSGQKSTIAVPAKIENKGLLTLIVSDSGTGLSRPGEILSATPAKASLAIQLAGVNETADATIRTIHVRNATKQERDLVTAKIKTLNLTEENKQELFLTDRKAALWALGLKGQVGIAGLNRLISSATDLPTGPFEVERVDIPREAKLGDEQTTMFAGLKKLKIAILSGTSVSLPTVLRLASIPTIEEIHLADTPVNDEGLKVLSKITRLRLLTIANTSVTDVAINSLGGHPALEDLNLHGTRASHQAAAALAKCPKLEKLFLSATQVTDDSLQALESCRTLRELTLTDTSVSKAGVQKLAAALPMCKITWNGGTINPQLPSNTAGLGFDGQSTYVSIPTLEFDSQLPISIEAWITPKTVDGKARHLFLFGEPGGGIGFSDRGNVGHGYFDGSVWHNDYGRSKLAIGSRVHVASVVTAKKMELFLNGQSNGVKNVGIPKLAPVQPPALIGKHTMNVPKGFYHGTVHALRISKSARYTSDFQPKNIWATDADTIALYRFDEGAGTKLIDHSGRKHDGIITDGTWVK